MCENESWYVCHFQSQNQKEVSFADGIDAKKNIEEDLPLRKKIWKSNRTTKKKVTTKATNFYSIFAW